MTFKTSIIGACAAVALFSTPALAEEMSRGKEVFTERCAVCHGAEGKGDGVVGELFRQKPKDLTLLAKENGGVFPTERVYQAIDGRARVPAHGETNMPVWGEFFMVQSLDDPPGVFDGEEGRPGTGR